MTEYFVNIVVIHLGILTFILQNSLVIEEQVPGKIIIFINPIVIYVSLTKK